MAIGFYVLLLGPSEMSNRQWNNHPFTDLAVSVYFVHAGNRGLFSWNKTSDISYDKCAGIKKK